MIFFFFFNDTATTEIYTLSLHDALPILQWPFAIALRRRLIRGKGLRHQLIFRRSEEHTSELQSPCNLVCRLLLEKKKTSFYSYRYSYTPCFFCSLAVASHFSAVCLPFLR